MTTPLVYEVTLDIEAGAATEFDAWLKEHVQAMLALPGFHDARILRPEGAEPGSGAPPAGRRGEQYTLGSREELDRYLAEDAPRMRAEGASRFGDRLKSSRRVLDVQTTGGALALPGLALPPSGPRCRNCGTPLSGKFCMECGQKNHTYVAPLWHVLHEFASSHFGFDTKFFHSIVPLLFRPGFLTREYCLGHEERYVKPFRLYLFSSILFFFLAAIFWPQLADFDSGNNVRSKLTAGTRQMSPEQREQTRTDIQKAMTQIDASDSSASAKGFAKSILQQQLAALDKAAVAATVAAAPSAATGTSHSHLHISVPGAATAPLAQATAEMKADRQRDRAKDATKGEDEDFDIPSDPDAKPGSLNDRIVQAFRRVKQDPDAFKKQLKQNLPKMMFILMPLIALFLKLFYIGTKRYLTEHFVFTLHFHSMVFVVMLFVMLLGGAAHHVAWLAPLSARAGTVAGWYMVIYMFLAMRFFYRQGWWFTGLKFFMLFVSYTIAVALTFAFGVVLTAVEI